MPRAPISMPYTHRKKVQSRTLKDSSGQGSAGTFKGAG